MAVRFLMKDVRSMDAWREGITQIREKNTVEIFNGAEGKVCQG
jgi:hypothetical protein